MKQFIPLASPNIGKEEIKLVNKVLKSGMLVQGKYVKELEQLVSNYIGVNHAICVSNGTASLHLILKALDIGIGDEVIVPAFSYIASANVVELVGAKPVFVDVDIQTFNLNPQSIIPCITKNTKAIMVVHEFGLSADLNPILEIAKQYGLFIIEDAACAIGAVYDGKKIGSFGIAGSFSLHPRKVITSGEGGIITTDNEVLAEKIRVLRNHGIQQDNGKIKFIEAGFNYRMTDIQAALTIPQFIRLDAILLKRNRLARMYLKKLDTKEMTLPSIPEGRTHTWQSFHILVSKPEKRNALIHKLLELGIGSNYGAQCIPATDFYQKKYKLDLINFKNAMIAYNLGLAIPLYEKLNNKDIEYISQHINMLIHAL